MGEKALNLRELLTGTAVATGDGLCNLYEV